MSCQYILRLPQVKQRTGLSRSTIYALVKSGQFKKPISLGARAVGWLESDVEEFIAARIKTSRSQHHKNIGDKADKSPTIPAMLAEDSSQPLWSSDDCTWVYFWLKPQQEDDLPSSLESRFRISLFAAKEESAGTVNTLDEQAESAALRAILLAWRDGRVKVGQRGAVMIQPGAEPAMLVKGAADSGGGDD